MNKITIPKNQWIEVYNSVILLLYFRYEYKNNNSSIQGINDRYNAFCEQNNIVGTDFHFEGGANMISFCYLIIVRIIEIINKSAGSNGHAKQQFFEWSLQTAQSDGIASFDNLIEKYEINLRSFYYSNEKSDGEKLRQLFRHLRHSISHYSYEINLSSGEARFTSIDPKSNNVQLDMSVPMFQVLNLTGDFGRWVNNTIHQKNMLS